ncbi:MAG TPA: dihydrolipoamide acetyltransferase family protein [Polyangiaceae bacterium]|jgi:2-oxoglutarate dehydrogenase E2 component (dihydrolipoamide succinyltransferase)
MVDVTLPQLGESVTEGTISKWLVKEGDVVAQGQALLSVSTDKADAEVPAPAAGRVARLLAKEGDIVAVRSVVAQIEEGAGPAKVAPPPATKATPPPPQPLASPSVRKDALEAGVNLGAVQGTGEHGRITKDDVARAKSPEPAATEAPPTRTTQLAQMINTGGGFVPPIPGVGYGNFKVPAYKQREGDQIIPFTRRRRITADHMTYSKFASPHVVTVAEVDLHKSAKLREANKDRYKKEGHALTMLAFVVVACARALRETPAINARVLDDAFVIFKDINVGVAVDSPDGLVVPVIRRADELGVRGIVRAIDELAQRAKTGKITIDDLSGATFSVSNPGLKGNLFGGAIINQPNVGILRMGEIQKRVVVVESEDGEDHMVIHPVMYMALSYDHRIVDGVAANAFLWRVTELLEKADFEV